MLRSTLEWCAVAGWLSACVASDARVEVTSNELGVRTIAVDRPDHDVVELRGFDVADQQVALVRLRTDVTLADITQYFPGDDIGSEITFSVAGHDTRMITRERELFQIVSPDDPATSRFLQLHEVATALEHDARIIILPASHEASPETALSASACSASDLLTSPLASQCCFSGEATFGYSWHTRFVNPAGAVTTRVINAIGNSRRIPGACKAADGVSACSGTGCYYGPNSFARAVVTTPPPGTPYAKVYVAFPFGASYPVCTSAFYSTPQTPQFGNVTGTYPTGQGCPGGASGGAWDYW